MQGGGEKVITRPRDWMEVGEEPRLPGQLKGVHHVINDNDASTIIHFLQSVHVYDWTK